MKIIVQQGQKVKLIFQGKINMSQEVMISKDDAHKLSEILTKDESASFDTE